MSNFARHPGARSVRVRTLIALAALGAALQPTAAALATTPDLAAPPICTAAAAPKPVAPAPDARARGSAFASDAFVRTELYFGSERPAKPEVSPKEFKQFLDLAVTPCFPDGLTLLTGKGQFRESDGRIVHETSFVLVLLYPLEARRESDGKIEALRSLYRERFEQESVLRVDDPRPVRVGF